MKRLLRYFTTDKVDLIMFITVPALAISSFMKKDTDLLIASVSFAWVWMMYAIIRMGMFRDKLAEKDFNDRVFNT